MKIFYKIFVVVFIILSIFILRDDINSVLGDVSSFLNKNIKNQIQKISDKEEINLSNKKIDTPGALRVVDDLLNINNKDLLKEHVIQITNQARKENGELFPLKENLTLNLSAEKKLQDMFTNQYFEHISPKGVGVGELGEQNGYDYILIGENLALGNFKDDEDLVEAWMNSPGHKANILNTHYTEIGVAVGEGQFEGKNVWIAVQHFGTPRSICPIVDEVLAGTIDINQNKIKEIEEDLSKRLEIIDKGVIYEGISYFEQIDQYNNLINSYNNLIKITKQKIDKYNDQVRIFNLCISENK
jgi:uncharacterized protein YkwD